MTYQLKTRNTELFKKQSYAVSNTTLVKSWTVKTPGVKLALHINGIKITPEDHDGINFNIQKLRSYIRGIIPISQEENELCIGEATIFGSQLVATDYYKTMSASDLFNFLYTGTLCTTFSVIENTSGNDLTNITLEEEYVQEDDKSKN